MVIFRENSEDIYAGIEWEEGSPEVAKVIEFLTSEEAIENAKNLDLDLARNRILVADTRRHGVVAVDLTTGNRSLITGLTRGNGPRFQTIDAVVPHLVPGQLLAVDFAGGLFLIDEASGDRVILSK